MFNKDDFNSFITNNNIVGFFENPITLKSWRISNWYANWRNVTEDVYLTDKLTDFIVDFIEDNNLDPDCIYWVPEWASKTAIISQFKLAKKQSNYWKWSHILAMWRWKPKDHWAPKDKFFVWEPKWKVIVLEDTTTTWWSLITTLEKLQESWTNVVCALALFNRCEKRDDGKSVEEKIADMWIKYINMSDAFDILPKVVDTLKPSQEIVSELKSYFDKYWVSPLNI